MTTRGKIRAIVLKKRIEPFGLEISDGPKVSLTVEPNGVWVTPRQIPNEPMLVPWASIHYANADVVAVPEPAKPTTRRAKRRKAGA
jgi:hypothetical protein